MASLVSKPNLAFQDIASNLDKEICDYIQNHSVEEYDNILENDDRMEVFMALSPLRHGMVCWYDFELNASVLETSGEFGQITQVLCDKCKYVATIEKDISKAHAIKKRIKHGENLKIYSDLQIVVDSGLKFDYILISNLYEVDIHNVHNYLKTLCDCLKHGGKLLFALDNRYGLKYFCGDADPIDEIPFGTLNRYYEANHKFLYNREEILDIIQDVGVTKYKFYYLLPDYRVTQVVLTDSYMSYSCIKERVVPYYRNKESLIANEMNLYRDIIKNNVFPFFANSFLVEACLEEGQISSIEGAILSLDRGDERGYITKIYGDRVEKEGIGIQAVQNLKLAYQHAAEIAQRGINVIEQRWVNRTLEMPRVYLAGGNEFLENCSDAEEVRGFFELLYQNIIRSSEQVDEQLNCMCKAENVAYAWGPILKKAYIDMIPANLFVDGKKVLYYDQEFIRENCPAKYVLYRAIKYCYIYNKNLDNICARDKLQRYFEMEDIWDCFEEEEERFISDVRRMRKMHHYYDWTGAKGRIIYDNTRLLLKNKLPNTPNKGIKKNKVMLETMLHQMCNIYC